MLIILGDAGNTLEILKTRKYKNEYTISRIITTYFIVLANEVERIKREVNKDVCRHVRI